MIIPPRKTYGTPSVRMPTRKYFVAVTTVVISLTLLLYSRRLGTWLDNEPYYAPHKSQHAPLRSPVPLEDTGNDTLNTTGQSSQPIVKTKPPIDPICDGFPDTSKILLVMKTGASEAFARLPIQMMTVLKCLPDYLIFSDMEQTINGVKVHDSLSTVRKEAQDGNPDFDLYRRQKWCQIDQESCNKLGDPASEGWNLDKYKNIHMADRAFHMRPGYDWYLFVDADTYVVWSNMVEWVKQLNPKKKHYLGSVTLINGFSFGHGGSGYMLSKRAMQDFIGDHPGIGNEWDIRAKSECCGDYLFAVALKQTSGLQVQNAWPTINGEKPTTLPYGPSHWCHPIVTMHHMNSEEIERFWNFERERARRKAQSPADTQRPLLIRDIYYEYVAPKLNETRKDWDNLSENQFYLSDDVEYDDWMSGRIKPKDQYNEEEKNAHLSFEDCGRACKSLGPDECFQWRYKDGTCGFSNSFLLGHPVEKETEEKDRWISGWDMEKIDAWVERHATCDDIRWPKVKGWSS
ncbi:hypothetical protein QBC35DRAFT_439459 [Podospora australis]|uniref:Glycosyltransferase Family 31 n=1 Tax=Podospora australis TaxID=1536484 RepID=A0AAN6WS61_9PEZI|nr:hypothetical protein QBC35DRAFT_439459 [Podospora australis]